MNAVSPSTLPDAVARMQAADAALNEARTRLGEISAQLPELEQALANARKQRIELVAGQAEETAINENASQVNRTRLALEDATAIRDRYESQLPTLVSEAVQAEAQAVDAWRESWREVEMQALRTAGELAADALKTAYGAYQLHTENHPTYKAYCLENFRPAGGSIPAPDGGELPRRQPRALALTATDREGSQ